MADIYEIERHILNIVSEQTEKKRHTIEEYVQRSVRTNFEVGGRFGDGSFGGGTNKWKPSIRAARTHTQTLMNTRNLYNTIIVRLEVQAPGRIRILIESRYLYSIFNERGAHRTGRWHTGELTARPFAVIQEDDINRILVMLRDG